MDAFDHDGLWWDPRVPDEKWVGTLRFNEIDGTVLSITVPTEKPEFSPRLQNYDLILGLTTSSKAVTLLRCFDRSSSGSLFGFPRRIEIFANSLVVGFHCEALDPLISTASVSFRHLADWWGASAIEHDQSTKLGDASVRYLRPEPVVVHDGDSFCVTIRSSLSMSRQPYISALTEDIRIEIQAAIPRPLREFLGIVQACEDFLSIACVRNSGVEEVALIPFSGEGGRAQIGTLHGVPVYQPTEGRSRVAQDLLLFRFSDIQERPQIILGAWLTCAEKLKRVRSLYFSGVYGQGFLETKLIALAQAAEAFHRRFYSGEYMEREEFDGKIFEPLKAAVPTNIDASFRQSLISRLNFANEHSLRRRMKELVSEHEVVLSSLIDNPKEFIDSIVNHRNDFTHHPADKEESAPDPNYSERVLQFNYLLRILLDMCFLKVMGFSPAEMVSLASRCGTYQQISQRFFRKLP